MKPILKYPGSKWRIAQEIVNLFPQHRSYVEPFFGSGAVLFNKELSSIETINDIDNDIVNLFQIIRDEPEKLQKLLCGTPYARSVYDEVFVRTPTNKYEQAIFFLIKCWQGHGYRLNGGKTGWRNDVQGREKAYALLDWNNLSTRINEVTQRLRMVQIDNVSAISIIKKFNYDNVLMYLDPPYVMGTRRYQKGQYKHEMTNADHVELLQTVKESKAKIIISGYASKLYDSELHLWNRRELASNDNKGKATVEVVWMNYEPPTQLTIDDFIKESIDQNQC